MEVAAAFKSQGFEFGEGDDVAKECLAMCHHFQASPEDVATSWDSYYTVNQAKMKTHVPTAAHMEAFRAHFERHVASAKKSNAVKTPQAYVYGKRSLAESLESGALDVEMADAAVDASLAAVTPGRKGDTPGAKTAGARAGGLRAGRVSLPPRGHRGERRVDGGIRHLHVQRARFEALREAPLAVDVRLRGLDGVRLLGGRDVPLEVRAEGLHVRGGGHVRLHLRLVHGVVRVPGRRHILGRGLEVVAHREALLGDVVALAELEALRLERGGDLHDVRHAEIGGGAGTTGAGGCARREMASWRVRARDFPPRLKKRCQVFLKSPLAGPIRKKNSAFEKDDAIGRVQRGALCAKFATKRPYV